MTVATSASVTAAVLVALKTLGRPIGDAQAPDGAANPPPVFFPYGVVYTGITRIEGSALDPHETGLVRVQVTAVGRTRAGAEDFRDKCRALLLTPDTVDPDGYVVVSRQPAGDPEVTRNDALEKPVFEAVTVVNLLVTPTSGS